MCRKEFGRTTEGYFEAKEINFIEESNADSSTPGYSKVGMCSVNFTFKRQTMKSSPAYLILHSRFRIEGLNK